MQGRVTIHDDRAEWMKKEDNTMACMTRCRLFRKCSNRYGKDCKRLGGTKIPKVRG